MRHRRMFADYAQDASQIDNLRAVQLQCRNGRAPGRRQSDQFAGVIVPAKMLFPAILTWMIEWDVLQRHWIKRKKKDVLEVVAALTGKRQIVSSGAAPGGQWNNMLIRKWVRRESLLAQTIFATEVGAYPHQSFQPFGEFSSRHNSVAALTDPSIHPA